MPPSVIKQTVPAEDLDLMAAYIHKRGSLNLGRRVEQIGAEIVRAAYFGKTKDPVDIWAFMPHEEKPTASHNEVKNLLRGV